MERKEIKKMLPPGWVTKIANETGYSTGSVYHWMQGRRNNLKIEKATLEYLVEVLEERKKIQKRLSEAI